MSQSFPTLALDPQKGRNLNRIKKQLPLSHGLKGYYLLGTIFLVFPLLLFVLLFAFEALPSFALMTALLLLFELAAFYFLFKGNQILHRRSSCLVDGELMEGQLIAQNEKWNWGSLSKQYEIELQLSNGKTARFFWPQKTNQAPLDGQQPIWGLYNSQREIACFVEEIGLQLAEEMFPKGPSRRR
ncbi:hypothetical protein PPO43_03690 [Saprospira sp. CCB-QB6]|uniref:hypothetical protein n=1 Tax=Saprospira sp. CCB-QB6 TaxID=3023936 RepID=UPI00234A0D6E|nr:hypothetical protein [Saprospira sp. CCB-QB6]WCL82205.1 hypothetical protein PPO43_03690 [Saprospira sp. CCB-QB6]